MIEFKVIIPARYASTRLPGKPLLKIAGKPMIQHVYESAIKSGASNVVIATDDERIQKAAKAFKAEVCMTSSEHTSGTDRVAEAIVKLGYNDEDIIINMQGDEPLIPAKTIELVAKNLATYENAKTATICEPIISAEELLDPNVVKVVMNKRGYAMYFSRAPIAWDCESFPLKPDTKIKTKHYRHRGIYAYRVNSLLEFTEWEPCPLEQMENLEQLRTLWNGGKIHVGIVKEKIPTDINTAEDLAKIQKFFK
jgi:3-deoxy-manno-octulosonate cytidylyltransferase (CMP-KDO synthetase)